MNNNITIFNNELFGSVRTMMIDDNPWFVGKDIAEALGYKDANKAVKDHVDKEDLKACSRKAYADLAPSLWTNKNDFSDKIFINESGVYALIFGSKKPEAKAFKRWVTSEVLPTIRQVGCYITENAQPEAIDFQSKFGIRRIRKTFRETTDIESTWTQYKELSKIERDAHRINNKDRMKACDIIVDELSDYIANNTTTMKASKVILYKEVIEEVLNTKQLWSNKMYGGIKSNMTVKINNLEQENKALKQQVEELTPTNHDWITCDAHGFSENYMYSWSNKGQVSRSNSYNRWISAFPTDSIPSRDYYEFYYGIDFTKEIAIEISYICKEDFDVKNFDKATLDMIFNRTLGIDDNIVARVVSTRIGKCDRYEDGKILFTIYNI